MFAEGHNWRWERCWSVLVFVINSTVLLTLTHSLATNISKVIEIQEVFAASASFL